MYDSSIVLLAPGTFSRAEIAFVPPPLETIVNLYGEEWILFTIFKYFFN